MMTQQQNDILTISDLIVSLLGDFARVLISEMIQKLMEQLVPSRNPFPLKFIGVFQREFHQNVNPLIFPILMNFNVTKSYSCSKACTLQKGGHYQNVIQFCQRSLLAG